MTVFTEPRVIIVPAWGIALANAFAFVADPDGGSPEAFCLRASATGEEPATHYALSALLTVQTAALLDDADATNLHAALTMLSTQNGRPYTATAQELQTLRDGSHVIADTLDGALLLVGLSRVQEQEEA